MDEYSLDGKDNVLMGRPAIEFARGERWVFSLERYWSSLLRELRETFEDAASQANIGIAWHPSVNLRKIETYWECRVDDPLAWITEIEPILMPLGLRSEARTYPFDVGLSTVTRESNSRRILVRLRSGVSLRVYAKTTKRIRFELVHDLVENARPICGGHTSVDPNQLYVWASQVAEDAAIEMNRVLEILEAAQARSGDEVSVTSLVCRLTQIVGDEELALQLLSMLATNQSITVDAGSALREAVQRLRRRSVLEPTQAYGRTYRPTAPYRAAALRLHRALQ